LGQVVRTRKLFDDGQPAQVGLYPNGVLVQTPGLFGGRSAVLPGAVVRDANGGGLSDLGIGALITLTSPDEIAELRLAGGSGFGDPLHRALDAVQRDLDGDYVTPEAARRDYGAAVGADGRIDIAASRELRRRRAIEIHKRQREKV
jgi:5-oxoprolinase (ATP-hydrolysing)/N-methylhydantoinase A